MPPSFIWDIPCYIDNPIFTDAIHGVLLQIKERNPKDFQRLQKLVLVIKPFDNAGEADLGECLGVNTSPVDQVTRDICAWEKQSVIMLAGRIPHDHLIAVVAHEFGHAATRAIDLYRRGHKNNVESKWRSELTADWYAYKWGFGRQITEHRPMRDWRQHSTAPGSTFKKEYGDGEIFHFKISRNFVVHLIKVTEETID